MYFAFKSQPQQADAQQNSLSARFKPQRHLVASSTFTIEQLFSGKKKGPKNKHNNKKPLSSVEVRCNLGKFPHCKHMH